MSLFLSSLLLAGAAMGAPLQPSDPVFTNATITPPINGRFSRYPIETIYAGTNLLSSRHYPFSSPAWHRVQLR